MLQAFPEYDEAKVDAQAMQDLEWVKQFIIAIRNIRGEMDISPSKPISILLKNVGAAEQRRLDENQQFLSSLAKLEAITLLAADEEAPISATSLLGDMEILIPMAGLIDKDAEIARISKQMDKVQKELDRVAGKLNNEKFVSNAPEAVIAKEQEKLAEFESTIAKLVAQRSRIEAI